MTTCPNCDGTGAVPMSGGEPPEAVDNGYVRCPDCGGSGQTMTVTEVTHHGQYRHQRAVTLPAAPSRADVAAMLATCAYPYTQVAPERLDKVHADLVGTGTAQHGWTTWTVVP